MKQLWLLIVAFLLVSCSTMPDIKVKGVDHLAVTEHKLGQWQVIMKCANLMHTPLAVAMLFPALACAKVNLSTWTCDIYYSKATEDFTLAHERKHCKGYWHDDGLQKYYDAWRKHPKTAYATGSSLTTR